MSIKIGDRVRFLNATGGGKVSKIITKDLIEVTGEDGFDIPTLVRECVVVERAEGTPEDTSSKNKATAVQPETQPEKEKEYIPEETPEGENLNVWLAFLPVNIKQLSTTAYECYLINDSNYYLSYNISGGEGDPVVSYAAGSIQPNTKLFLDEIKKEQLNKWELIQVQMIAFKKEKKYSAKPVYDVSLQLNPVEFYKLHSFIENDFFDEFAYPVRIVNNNRPENEPIIIEEDITTIIREKEQKQPKKIFKKKEAPAIIEVDLHISRLIDNFQQLSNSEMMKIQLKKFNDTLKEYDLQKGQKIVFIHGKGEGVLRNEILKQLKNSYPAYLSQDASFKEYGFGATMVIIK